MSNALLPGEERVSNALLPGEERVSNVHGMPDREDFEVTNCTLPPTPCHFQWKTHLHCCAGNLGLGPEVKSDH